MIKIQLYNFFLRFEFEAGYRKKSLTDVLVLLERGGGVIKMCSNGYLSSQEWVVSKEKYM